MLFKSAIYQIISTALPKNIASTPKKNLFFLQYIGYISDYNKVTLSSFKQYRSPDSGQVA